MAGKTVRGRCGLCLNEAQLRDSHLLPASIYRLSREAASKNPNPVVVTGTGAVATSRQVSAHFLCDACEDRLSRGGETYVVAQCARPGGSFALRSLLMSTQPLMRDSVWSLFDISGTPAKIDQFLYFAASIFWRSSAKAWSSGGPPKKCIVLGQNTWKNFADTSWESRLSPPDHACSSTSGTRTLFISRRPSQRRSACKGRIAISSAFRELPSFCLSAEIRPDNFDEGALNSSSGAYMWLCPWQETRCLRAWGEW
jgi:hypothetical protein